MKLNQLVLPFADCQKLNVVVFCKYRTVNNVPVRITLLNKISCRELLRSFL